MSETVSGALKIGLFNLEGGEIILILALILILFRAKHLPQLGRGLSTGLQEFRRASRAVGDEADQAAAEAGEALGGIYGKVVAAINRRRRSFSQLMSTMSKSSPTA